jgi:hypothetical protein
MLTVLIALISFAAIPAVAQPRCNDSTRVGQGSGLVIFGLTTDQVLMRFRECNPAKLDPVGFVIGFQAPDTALVGIDFRVQDGKLYGVGNSGGIYTIDHDTAMATKVSQLTVSLNGTNFGVDFNPAADRLRIISDTGQNLRHNVNAMGVTVVDAPLNYTAGVTAAGLTGAAYTNNDLDPTTATTLFDIDANLNQVVVQSPPNAGSLAPTGQLTLDVDAPIGFDIYTTQQEGVAIGNNGFASLIAGRVSGFYRVNLLTGKVSLIDSWNERFIDIAIPVY